MGLFDSIGDLASGIEHSIEDVGKGVGHAVEGVGKGAIGLAGQAGGTAVGLFGQTVGIGTSAFGSVAQSAGGFASDVTGGITGAITTPMILVGGALVGTVLLIVVLK